MENENKGLSGHRHRAQSIIQWKSLDQLEKEAVKGLYENIDYRRGSSYRIILCEVVYGLLWWTSFQLISSCICHPDVLILSSPSLLSSVLISLFLLSPSLLIKMAKFQAIASNPIVLLVVRLLSVLPMIVCQFPGPGNRLAAMCVGGVGCVMAIVGGWCNTSCIDRHRRVFYHFYGLVLYLAVKIYSMSFNPLLTGTYIGTMATVTGIVLIIALSLLDKPTPILKVTDLAKMKIKMPRNYQLVDVDTHVWVWLGVGFGCQLFLTQLLFTDSNVLPRWCGINSTSLFSSLVVIALCLGINSSIDRYLHLIVSSQWLAIGTISLMVFYYATRIVYAFVACLLLTVHLSGVWLCICTKLTRPMPILVGLMVYLLLMRVGVWGEVLSCLLSQWLALPALVLQWTCLNKWVEFGISTGRVKKSPKHSGKTEGSKKIVRKGSHIRILGQIIRRLSTVSEFEEEEDSDGGEGDKERRDVHRERLKELLASELQETKYFNDNIITKASLVLCIVALLGSAYCYIPSPHSSHINKQVVDGVFNITVVSFNGGYDSTGKHIYAHWNVLETINQSGSNIVCLHDISREFLISNVNLQDTIGRHVGMSAHLSQQRNPKVAILTRYEVISSELSDGVVLELKIADNTANPLTVYCHNTIRPDSEFIDTSASPLLVISKETEKQTHDDCLNLFVYTKGLEQIKRQCNNEDGSSTINLRITHNG